MPKFSENSLRELDTCDIMLQGLFHEVIKHWDCIVIDGSRTEAEQVKNVARGVSRTMDSKHLRNPSQAVDVAPYPLNWNDTPRFYAFSGFVMGVATMMGIKVRWGGDWDGDRDLKDQKLNDLVHFELV